jgi:hypothetical protein
MAPALPQVRCWLPCALGLADAESFPPALFAQIASTCVLAAPCQTQLSPGRALCFHGARRPCSQLPARRLLLFLPYAEPLTDLLTGRVELRSRAPSSSTPCALLQFLAMAHLCSFSSSLCVTELPCHTSPVLTVITCRPEHHIYLHELDRIPIFGNSPLISSSPLCRLPSVVPCRASDIVLVVVGSSDRHHRPSIPSIVTSPQVKDLENLGKEKNEPHPSLTWCAEKCSHRTSSSISQL